MVFGGIVVVLVVLIVSVASVVGTVMSARLRGERGLRKDWLGNEVPHRLENGEADAALRQEVTDLRERVKVLERIVTDGGSAHAIAAQIENLREEPLAAAQPKAKVRS